MLIIIALCLIQIITQTKKETLCCKYEATTKKWVQTIGDAIEYYISLNKKPKELN